MKDSEPFHVLSLGAGVQSSALALMAMEGKIKPMPKAAIFADTAEPDGVYQHLEWLKEILPFPVYVVTQGKGLTEHLMEAIKANKFASVPFHTKDKEGRKGQLRRQCTREFKIAPIERKIRELAGLKKGQNGGKEVRVIQWIGISTDEIQRMMESRIKWIHHRFPLIELRMNRTECLTWMEQRGYRLPVKSACTYCPYHSDSEWRSMKKDDPDSFQQAVEMDRLIRSGVRETPNECFVHQTGIPLEDVDFSTDFDKGQMALWSNECDGVCGL